MIGSSLYLFNQVWSNCGVRQDRCMKTYRTLPIVNFENDFENLFEGLWELYNRTCLSEFCCTMLNYRKYALKIKTFCNRTLYQNWMGSGPFWKLYGCVMADCYPWIGARLPYFYIRCLIFFICIILHLHPLSSISSFICIILHLHHPSFALWFTLYPMHVFIWFLMDLFWVRKKTSWCPFHQSVVIYFPQAIETH